MNAVINSIDNDGIMTIIVDNGDGFNFFEFKKRLGLDVLRVTGYKVVGKGGLDPLDTEDTMALDSLLSLLYGTERGRVTVETRKDRASIHAWINRT